MTTYYNEFDPYAAQWLRNLIQAGHIAPGYVDERSIEDICPSELASYTQCHFFAGIGVWSLALRRAGWPDTRPVWTGSCPCQPFSAAGKGAGFSDERHLWPAWFHIISERRPAIIFGEQIAKAPEWIVLVRSDMASMGYSVGAIPFEAASAGSFHLRDRLYFVADAGCQGLEERVCEPAVLREVACAPEGQDLADALGFGLASFIGPDGKRRPIRSGVSPLAHGAAERVGRIRAYGNAIDARQARAFIEAVMDAT